MSSLKLKHSGGNSVSLNPPSSAPTSSDVAFKLPNADGSANQIIKTDGSGNLGFTNAGKILQVVKTNVTASSSYGTTAATHYTLTPLNTTISPVGTNSHFIISAQVSGEGTVSNQQYFLRLIRNTTSGFADGDNIAIAVGDNGSNNNAPENTSAFHGYNAANNDSTISTSHISNYVDSPGVAAGGNLQYKVQLYMQTSTTWYLNRTKTEYNETYGDYLPSWLTVMEIGA